MIKRRWFAAGLLLVACGGGAGTASVQPASSAKSAVNGFMQAVADSNLDKMASLWGTARGPAAKTHEPSDYERRIAVMRAYLTHETARIISDTPDGSDARHAVQVEIRRQLCTWIVPFVAIKAIDGSWLVNQVDLTAAGNPARPCIPGADTTAADSAARQ